MGLETAAIASLLVATGGMTATSQIIGGRQEAKQIKRQSEFEASIFEQQASMINEQRNLKERQFNRLRGRTAGTTVAATAGKGLLLSGSPLAILVDTESEILLDQAVVDYNLQVERNFALSQAEFAREHGARQARLARTRGYVGMFSTILSTAGSLGSLGTGPLKPGGPPM